MNNNPSLNKIHFKLKKHILLTESYTEADYLSFIIKACRLKPYNCKINSSVQLYRWWVDEFGNSLKINNKKINIIFNDLSLDRNQIICTDLYHGFSIDAAAKMSRLFYLHVGKDKESLEDYFMLTFLGIDNYLRSYFYMDDNWKPISPLILGFDNLQDMGRNLNIKFVKELDIKNNWEAPCQMTHAWISCFPGTKVFAKILDKQYNDIFSFLMEKDL